MDKPEVKNASDMRDARPAAPVGRHRLKSDDLLGKSREIIIEHGDDEYRLRLTSQGKLILTK